MGGIFEGRQIRCQVRECAGTEAARQRGASSCSRAPTPWCACSTRGEPELEFGLEWLGELVHVLPRKSRRRSGSCSRRTSATPQRRRPTARSSALRVNQVAPIAIVESVAHGLGWHPRVVRAGGAPRSRPRSRALERGPPRGRQAAYDDARTRAPAEALKQAEIECAAREARAGARFDKLELDSDGVQRGQRDRRRRTRSDLDGESYEGDAERLFVPDPMMPGGMIWPPVDGRALLHEVSSLAIRPTRTPRGDWWGSGSGWCFHSRPRALYDHQLSARDQLVAWARLHAANADQISRRCAR